MMKKVILLLIVSVMTGCAMTYEAPTITAPIVKTELSKSSKHTLNSAKRTLLREGYQIQAFDDEAGFISTALINKKVTPAEADCGSTMGIDYLKDSRTKTQVAINIIVNNNDVVVKSNIQGEYKPGAVDQDITLTCISKGVIEQGLLRQI
jgi:hypothetical protein